MTYHRYTGNGPMSDWGHAMFVDNDTASQCYGKNHYIYDGKAAVDIEELFDEIIEKWNADKEDWFAGCNYIADADYWVEIAADEITNSFNPDDIVDSAQAYDNPELVQWLWDRVLEPSGIMAVITQDGAIVFDESLLKMVTE